MAPEVVKQTAYTSKADIWSLGCLVVEMLTGAHPWANLTQMQAIFRVSTRFRPRCTWPARADSPHLVSLSLSRPPQIGSSVRPTVPDDISTEADDFLEQTFEIDHHDRPSARELLEHGFIKEGGAAAEEKATGKEQQTPTRATFSQAGVA